ncbi:MAG: Hpt domain-containing protein [Bacilli bacterium]
MNQKEEWLKQNNVDVETSVENMIDFDTYYEILQDFYNTIDETIKKLVQFKDSNDMPNYAIEVHALKSNARSLGFIELGDISYEHELKSKEDDINYIINNFSLLLDKINQTKKIIEQCINL